MILALLYSLLSLSGACTMRANSTCTGSCVTNDTFFVWASDSGLSVYRVDNPYFASNSTKTPKSCLDIARPRTNIDTTFNYAFEQSAKSLMTSLVFWEMLGVGFMAVLLLSIPKWGFQSIKAMMNVFHRDEL